MVAPPMFLCAEPQTAKPPELAAVGANPPWNQPHVTPRALSRSPMFVPVAMATGLVLVWLPSEQSS